MPALLATGAGKIVKNMREREGEVKILLFKEWSGSDTWN